MARKPVLRKSKTAMAALTVGIVAQGVVIYWVSRPVDRLTLALLALTPIIWAAARLGVVQRIAQVLSGRPYRRRYMRLRAHVDQLLADIRRLNWAAVDQQRRFRSAAIVEAELDAIEAGLVELIHQIRLAAGKAAEDHVDHPGPEIEKALFHQSE